MWSKQKKTKTSLDGQSWSSEKAGNQDLASLTGFAELYDKLTQ